MADNPTNSQTNQEVVSQGKGKTEIRRTVAHLPAFYRTDANQRFLGSTLDPLVQKGSLQRLDGFIGRQDAYTRKNTDTYLTATSRDRFSYQLEPAVTYTDRDTTSVNPEDQVKFSGLYDDLINQIQYFGGKVNNHDRLNKDTVYSWNPAVDLDKLINYREYYWLPDGPNPITIDGVGPTATSTYKVQVWPDDGSSEKAWKLPHMENQRNPQITLYRGNTYKFDVDAKGHQFYIMTEPYKAGVDVDGSTSTHYTTGVTNSGAAEGTVTFTVPTTAPDVLYYQCGQHDTMYGILVIRSIETSTKINVDDHIIGTKNYSLRTLDLSNGMKIKFGTNVSDSKYSGQEYYVEGVGDQITLTNVTDLITPESYATETTILYDSVDFDTRPYAKAFYRPEALDYIVIKRDSPDQNAWSRYNRWFHKDVITQTAEIIGYTPTLLETDRAKRPIIEFDSGIRLYNHGSVAKTSVALFDTVTTDAFSDVVRQNGYIVDGISLQDGMRVIFANDSDPIVKGRIYKVNMVSLSDDSATFINLTEESDGIPALSDSVFVELGTDNQGKTYFWGYGADSTLGWQTAQTKTKVNQQPLFDLFDENDTSFTDSVSYPDSSFAGANIFEYKTSDSATKDTVLGIKVKYNTINNVGDIVFESDWTSDTFKYTSGDSKTTTKLATGHLHYTQRTGDHVHQSAWIKRTNESKQRVIRTFTVDETEKQLFPIDFYENSASLTDLELSVRVNSVRQILTTDYTLENGTTRKYIKFVEELEVGDQIRIAAHSATTKIADKGVYEIPENLSTNPANEELGTYTYGQILKHLQDIYEKNSDLTGDVLQPSNLRDKPDARLKGGTILQHEGSLLAGIFGLIDQEANVITAIEYCSREYEKFYNAFLTYAVGTAYEGLAADRVDEIITGINQGRNSSFPFYYEDMMGVGENFSLRTYTVMDPTETEYAIDSVHAMTAPNNRAVYVYVNDVQLIKDTDYTVSTTDDSIDISKSLTAGDIVKIRDYSDTTGSYVPPTPTKLGMYPKYKPELFTDDTYITSQTVIRKHDGSVIKAYGDERDDLILEFEKRIYNNIKTQYDSELLDIGDVTPSAFTSTEYTLTEINEVMGPDFYVWAGRNNVQYINNTAFSEGSAFTYNYSASTDTKNKEKLPGYWRAIYKYFYDTDAPHVRPWEMFGHSEKPSDWESKYGSAPYTSGNTVLWDALAAEPGRYGKPTISSYLPVDESGTLLNPLQIGLIYRFDVPNRKLSWKFGDQAPAETAWRRSSAYPFTVIKTLALTKPCKFFGIYFDNSRLTRNISGNLVDTITGIRQRLATAKYHIETETNNATGVTIRTATAGYQPFVINYLISKSLDPNTFFYMKMKALKVQLAYKLGGFTDKDNLKVLTDSVSPGSTAGSKFIPDENYKILFRTSNPVKSFNYSGVLIELNTDLSIDGSTLTGGYKVLGYSTTKPFFNFFYPRKNLDGNKISVAGVTAATYPQYQPDVQTIPYGHVFNTIQDVVDFLLGHGKWLESQGFKFDKFSKELQEITNWQNAAREFLFWTTQELSAGSAITVSPGADGFTLDTENAIVGRLRNLAGDYSLLDAGGRKIDIKNVSTKRLGKTFELAIKNNEGLYNVALNTVQKEHILIFDNKTVFSDIIYEPQTGFRQQRLKLVGWKTGEWNGDYYAPGFMFDAANVTYWTANTDYKIGDSVEYQGKFYVAKTNHNSSTKFINTNWNYKLEKPKPQLIPNFDYKITQFNDFYELETDNFDQSQQSLAQHLIGYQSRDYLENLFVNDVSQYKFYQGYIREKGTQNAINKLLKARYENQDISLDIYPEWMIRTGKFGNSDSLESIQVNLDPAKITSNRQSFEFFDTTNDTRSYTRSLYVAKGDMYSKPVDYSSSSTFARYNYDTVGVDRDSVRFYATAGYPQVSQVQHTFFNIDDLLQLDVNNVTTNDLVWIANKSNNDWDVLRITTAPFKIASLTPINDGEQLQIIFTDSHNLSAGSPTSLPDYFAIANSESEQANQVYTVRSVTDYKTVVVDYNGPTSFLPTLEDGSTADTYGNIYKFVSVRLNSMDNVNERLHYSDYKDKNTSILKQGDKVYADSDSNGLWRVYEKNDPYTVKRQLSPASTTSDQDFGYQIVARNDGRTVVISAPTVGQGNIHFLFRNDATAGTEFGVSSTATMTDNDDNTSRLGYSLSISTDENFVVAGAPFTNTTSSDGSTRYSDNGLVKIYLWNPATYKYSILNTITPPEDGSTTDSSQAQNFGWSHKICEPGLSSTRSTTAKYLFVGAPGYESDTGQIYMYEWGIGADGSTYDTWTECLTITSADPGQGKRFGHRLQANDTGNILAVSSVSPGNAGKVEIFRRTSQSNDDSTQHAFTLVQTLTGISTDGSSLNTAFGDSLTMSKDGTTLVIGAPGLDDGSTDRPDAGAVYYYKWDADGDSTLSYTLQQTLKAPDNRSNMKFGSSLDLNDDGSRLIIGAEKFANDREMKFDLGETTFDLQDTAIVDLNIGSGGVYTATMYNTKFVIDDRLVTSSVSDNDDFGRGVCVTDGTVYVGSPEDLGNDDSTVSNDGTVTVFDLTTKGAYAWTNIASETALMDIDKLGKVFEFNKGTKQIGDFLELYDPVKGRIPGVADREINIKTPWDPAQYNFGDKANSKTPWMEEHVGEVWWDLSKVKWVWYEQDSQEFKVNNWGKTFPGSSIDIYEWVESRFLPSEYVLREESGEVSGTPLYPEDTNYTVKQRYSSALDGFVNIYFYWVKNSTMMPETSVVTRKSTTSFISNLIADPERYGFKAYAPSDTNKFIMFRDTGNLVNGSVLNIDIRTNTFEGDAHSIWKLVREGDKFYRPGTQVETQWWNSLIGSNESGNKVPDPDLPVTERYGNNMRPRQSWYVDRFSALKEIIDYANTVLKKYQLAGIVNLSNLDSKDPEPTEESLEWDASVDTYADLTYIDTKELSGTVNYLVKSDETLGGFWAIYQWNGTVFSRTKVQTYNTSKYWSYVDWYKADGDMAHTENTPIDKQVTYQYELDGLDLAVGKHVKVTQADTGGWKLFMKTATGFTNVGTQNGTIRLSTKLYDYSQDDTGYAGDDAFDDNFFDQEPATETRKVLTALRDDLFVNELAVEYNTLFFTGLRKVLSEQTYVDWMFKTSFINARNNVRQLDQRKTYTVGTDSWIESYINEVKPFHTKLREYKLGYQSTDTQDGIFTDFDNPPFYDTDSSKIRNLNTSLDVDKLTEYPHQMWYDYHKKHVKSIKLISGGSGYTKTPTVTILGGTKGSTGPFQIYGTSNSGSTSGSVGYYYPLFTNQQQAEIYDSQNGGSGAAHTHTFDEYTGTFYMPTGSMNHAVSTKTAAFKMYTVPDNVVATATATVSDGSVTKVTLVTNGKDYTSTPAVIFTGGADDGSTPSDTAKAYAYLNNDLVRDIDTTIKFDRISSTSSVVDWAASTSYAYGQLIRYENQLYKATSAFTSTTKFNDSIGDLYKVYGDETGLTASDRTKGFYTPGSGMPGNELSQVMTGVDYGGTIVTGLLFSQDQGWDKSGWYDFSWDSYGKSRIKAFTATGTSATFTFDTAPLATDVFQVYQTRDDSTREKRSEVFRGDGSTTAFTLASIPDTDALIEFIPFDDDGVLTPSDDRTLDSIIKGGLFGSALGSAPSDVLLEGDGFVTPDTSYAPEEVVPGQMFDTVDIKVYTSPESGVPFISDLFSRGDGSTTTFPIGDFPGTLGSVTVTVDNVVKKLTTDYTVNVANKTITFGTAPADNAIIATKTFAISGENFRVIDQYTGDGSTTAFTTSTRGEFNLDSTSSEIFVTIEGVPTTAFTTSITANTVTVTFSSAPAADKLIQIAGFNKSATSTRSFASIRSEQITFDGSTERYSLTYPPGSIGPHSALTIVEVNGKVLRGPDVSYYVGDGSTYVYGVVSGLGEDSTVDPEKTITSAAQLEVHVNGVEKLLNTDYTVDISNQSVTLVTAPASNDVVAITTLINNQYFVDGGADADVVLDTAQISSDGLSLSASDVISVTTFNNALGMKLRREVLQGKADNTFKLRFDTLNDVYTYVWLNGEQLIANADYTVSGNTITVVSSRTITDSDRLDVMYFAVETAHGPTGFRIFKDMLNRTHYKRISKVHTTKLSNDITPESKNIQVVDGSILAVPNAALNMPGIIFVDKERIEYFTKDGNTLGQLRRGTLGTGIKDHSGGTLVVDASGTQTIPYTDTVHTDTHTGDGSSVTFTTTQAATSVSQLDVFVGGQRLLLTSEDGSTINYSVDGSTAAVTLSTAPADGTQIKILMKKGQVWYTALDGNPADGKGLQASTTAQARFIAQEPTNAPE